MESELRVWNACLEVIQEHGMKSRIGRTITVEENDGICFDQGANVKNVDLNANVNGVRYLLVIVTYEYGFFSRKYSRNEIRNTRIYLSQVAWLQRIS